MSGRVSGRQHEPIPPRDKHQPISSQALRERGIFTKGTDMKLGIEGRTAIVCGASKGLGWGCASALAAEGVRIILNARDPARLEATAAALRSASGVDVIAVPGDVGTAEGRAALLAACPEPDILVNNAGGPPPGDFREWEEEHWHRAVQNN